jgi:hypothetical protein
MPVEPAAHARDQAGHARAGDAGPTPELVTPEPVVPWVPATPVTPEPAMANGKDEG